MLELSILLKSGHTITIKCDGFEFQRDTNGNFVSYEIIGVTEPTQFGFAPKQIVGFVAKELK